MVSALVLQSTTATILLATSFISTGLLTLGVAIVVIIGADLGSALAARILFLDLSFLSPMLLIAGLGLHRFSRTWKNMQLGRILIGLGLMLLAIQLIRQTVAPISAQPVSPELLDFFQSVPWMILLACAVATWLAHSSIAIILVIASIAGSGLISPELTIAAVLGANAGAGLIPLSLVNRRNTEAYSAVVANLMLRSGLAIFVMLMSPVLSPYVSYLGADVGIRAIYIHILFNIVLSILFVPFNSSIAKISRNFLQAWQPENLEPGYHIPGSSLDSGMIKNTRLAITCARREAFRLADNLEAMFVNALEMFGVSDRSVIESFVSCDSEINARNRAIQEYLAQARRHINFDDKDAVELEKNLDNVLRFSSTMENIGDVVSHNLARLAVKRLDRNVDFSREGEEELSSIHHATLGLIQLEISRFSSNEKAVGKAKSKMIRSIRELGKASIENHRKRLSNQKSASLSTTSIHQDALRDLLQVVNLVENIKAG